MALLEATYSLWEDNGAACFTSNGGLGTWQRQKLVTNAFPLYECSYECSRLLLWCSKLRKKYNHDSKLVPNHQKHCCLHPPTLSESHAWGTTGKAVKMLLPLNRMVHMQLQHSNPAHFLCLWQFSVTRSHSHSSLTSGIIKTCFNISLFLSFFFSFFFFFCFSSFDRFLMGLNTPKLLRLWGELQWRAPQ